MLFTISTTAGAFLLGILVDRLGITDWFVGSWLKR